MVAWQIDPCMKKGCHFRNEKGNGAEMRPAIVSGIITGGVPFSSWPFFSPVLSNCLKHLCVLGDSHEVLSSIGVLKFRTKNV